MHKAADNGCELVESHFHSVEPVEQQGPKEVRQPALQPVEEERADRNAKDSANTELQQLQEYLFQLVHGQNQGSARRIENGRIANAQAKKNQSLTISFSSRISMNG
jgi:hypothetical protein